MDQNSKVFFSENELKALYFVLSIFDELDPVLWNVHAKIEKKVLKNITMREMYESKVRLLKYLQGKNACREK